MSPAQGTDLVRAVIANVQAQGFGILGYAGAPRPVPKAELDGLRLPGGQPLSPSMREWLAFDAGFLRWFGEVEHPSFKPQNVGELAKAAFGPDNPLAQTFESLASHALPGPCLLVPFGDQSRRFVYLSAPDSLGEYPVLLIDVDDAPFVCVEYPGIDVYLATHAKLLSPPKRVTGSYADDPRYRERMQHHIRAALGGRREIELGDEGFPMDEAWGPESG